MAKHHVERANQPLYYYLIGLTVYEFLVFVPTLLGGAYLAIKGSAFDRTLVAWAVLALVLFSYAGERMPWILGDVTLPQTLVAGRITGMLVSRAWGARFAPAGFVGGLGLAITVPFAIVQLIRTDDAVTSVTFWLAIVTIVVVVAGATVYAMNLRLDPAVSAAASALGVLQRERRTAVLAAAGLGAMATMLAFTVFVAGRANYSYTNFERPYELLVYSQTGEQTTYAAQCIERIAEGSGKGKEGLTIIVGEDDANAWQWRWYLRDYPNAQYRFFTNTSVPADPLAADVVLISLADSGDMGAGLDGFVRAGDFHHLWWFPNYAYSRVTPSAFWHGIRSRDSWRSAVNYFFGREYAGEMQHSNGAIYVAPQHAAYAEGCTDLRATKVDPLAN
jgi:hypothetical protein